MFDFRECLKVFVWFLITVLTEGLSYLVLYHISLVIHLNCRVGL